LDGFLVLARHSLVSGLARQVVESALVFNVLEDILRKGRESLIKKVLAELNVDGILVCIIQSVAIESDLALNLIGLSAISALILLGLRSLELSLSEFAHKLTRFRSAILGLAESSDGSHLTELSDPSLSAELLRCKVITLQFVSMAQKELNLDLLVAFLQQALEQDCSLLDS